MSIASLTFLLFSALTLLVYWLFPGRKRWIVLLAASLLFYAWGDGWYLPFVGFGIISTYIAARWIQAHADRDAAQVAAEGANLTREERKARRAAGKRFRRRGLVICLVLNFSVLAVLKYTGFVISIADGIGRLFGAGSLQAPTLLLPLGISFYTFRSTSYVIDVYRGKAQAQNNIARYALFVTFFPAVVQGPICRYNDLMPELTGEHSLTWEDFSSGLVRFVWGYFKKVAVADTALAAVRTIVQNPDELCGAYSAVLIILYSLVIYGDFTGGMDISLGLARMMGIRLTENFNRPFSARSTEEYWKRWHITMGSWFADYLFYPFSISKPMQKLSKWGRAHMGNWLGMRLPVWLATMFTWFMTGLWHGASWNFVVWGLLNGLVILVSNELRPVYAAFRGRFPRLTSSQIYGSFCSLRTFLLMGAIRSLDCYCDVGVTFHAFRSIFASPASWSDLFGGGAVDRLGLSIPVWIFLGFSAILFWTIGRQGKKDSPAGFCVAERLASRPVLLWSVCAVLVAATLIFGNYGFGFDAADFIYGQF